jgi:hypothetical protein
LTKKRNCRIKRAVFAARFFVFEQKERAADFQRSAALSNQNGSFDDPKQTRTMIIFVSVNLKEIFRRGTGYPWPRPCQCRRCGGNRLWGHGFVPCLFDGFGMPLWLKRYRCPDCGCVFRLRPEGWFSRFQASVRTIRNSVVSKSENNEWPPGLSRSRQRHWTKALRRKMRARLGLDWNRSPADAFDRLLATGIVPVSRAI